MRQIFSRIFIAIRNNTANDIMKLQEVFKTVQMLILTGTSKETLYLLSLLRRRNKFWVCGGGGIWQLIAWL